MRTPHHHTWRRCKLVHARSNPLNAFASNIEQRSFREVKKPFSHPSDLQRLELFVPTCADIAAIRQLVCVQILFLV